jgi:hypothetical protein
LTVWGTAQLACTRRCLTETFAGSVTKATVTTPAMMATSTPNLSSRLASVPGLSGSFTGRTLLILKPLCFLPTTLLSSASLGRKKTFVRFFYLVIILLTYIVQGCVGSTYFLNLAIDANKFRHTASRYKCQV